jgi:uncharacterized membrane protein YqgA involved in biofilm formation
MPAVFINVFAVILGACPGLLLRRGIPKKVSDIAMLALGLCSLYIGFSGSLQGNHVLILIPSMVLGAISGTLLDIDGRINRLAGKIEKKFQKPGKELSLAEGLVSATLLFCVGSMTVTGSLQAGLTGDYSILITKSCLDLISSFMLASTLGAGVLLSAVSVLVIQGGLVLLSGLAAPLMSPEAIQEMTCAGSLMILMIGTNLLGITKIKVADFLPGILFAPLLCLLLPFFEKLKDLFF